MSERTVNAPRLLLAGASSGCGKTTVSCAVLQALKNRGLALNAFKCGPDYIDPMFHRRAIGTRASNLDLFFYGENTLRFLLGLHSGEAELSVMEGVMGYYDGLGLKSAEKSSWDVGRAAGAPAVLIVSCRGMSLSAAAVVKGFLDFVPDSGIRGVILNNVSPASYPAIKEAVEERTQGRAKVYGYMPRMSDCGFESRHLGLVTADEMGDIKEKLARLAEQAEKSVELDALLELAASAPPLAFDNVAVRQFEEKIRIAVALDRAFCFYYRDNLELLERLGAEIVPFSPLADAELPQCDGLYLGGGYPELCLEELSGNASMRASVKKALEGGLPCIAECGGFMYLTEAIDGAPMVGFLPGKCGNTGRLTRFGYVTLTAARDNMLCRAGESIRAHEFHYWDAEHTGDGFRAERSGGRAWDCVFADDALYAGFPHLPFYSNPKFAENFYAACLKRRPGKEK